jgi:broad specificity phosphatase PhoE
MTTLFLARHAETPANVVGEERLRGLGDYPLTAHGRKQAQQLAIKLLTLGATKVATDDTLRARLTADYVGRALGVEPIHDPGLRPWDIGAFEGLLEAVAYPQLLWYIRNVRTPPPGGEAYADFFSAWRDAFWHYLNRAREDRQPWALVVHSGHFATLDDVRLERGSTPTRDYEPPPGQILAVDALSLQVSAI